MPASEGPLAVQRNLPFTSPLGVSNAAAAPLRPAKDWAAAKSHVDAMSKSADQIPTCQHLLDHSSSPYALLLASTVLRTLLTSHWNNFDAAQQLAVRDYLLQYLAERGPSLPPFVVTALVGLLCRLTKLGWFEDPRHRQVRNPRQRAPLRCWRCSALPGGVVRRPKAPAGAEP